MYKVMAFLSRKPGTTIEQLRDYYETRHVPLIGEIDQEPVNDQRAWIYWGPNWKFTKTFNAGSLGEIVLGE